MLVKHWMVIQTPHILKANRQGREGNFCLNLENLKEDDLTGLHELPVASCISLYIPENFAFFKNSRSENYDLLLRAFFNPRYPKMNHRPLIFSFSEEDPSGNAGWSFLVQKCVDQGLKEPLLLRVSPYHSRTHSGDFCFSLTKEMMPRFDIGAIIEEWMENFLLTMQAGSIHVFLKNEDNTVTDGFPDFSGTTEKRKLFSIAEKIYELDQLREKEYGEKEAVEKQVENLENYLDFPKQETRAILKFYRNEYEVLPLWYKQFGHIIKVLMGKRSFRSLFNDHVKKYKD